MYTIGCIHLHLSMGLERQGAIFKTGINLGEIRYGVGPSGKTILIESGDEVIIARPLRGATWSNEPVLQTPEGEYGRRREAVDLYERELPDLTLPTRLEIVEDQVGGEDVDFLLRFTPRLDDVRNMTELTEGEILDDPDICSAFVQLNLRALSVLIREGIVLDCGPEGNFGENCAGVLYPLTKRLITGNIMVGYDMDGEKRVVTDPDWFDKLGEKGNKKAVELGKKVGLYSLRIIFFTTAGLIRRFKNK